MDAEVGRRAMATLAVMALAAVLAPSSAAASSVSGGGHFSYTAGQGEVNRVSIAPVSTPPGAVYAVVVSDTAPVRVLQGCSRLAGNPHRARCVVTNPDEPRFIVGLGDGNDVLRLLATSGPGAFVSAGTGNDFVSATKGGDFFLGAGNDTFRGGSRQDNAFGGLGNDRIYGLGGDDLLLGDAGNDVIYGGLGNDCLGGGPGLNRLFGGPGRNRLNCRVGDTPGV